ncbi:MAG TPA: protein-glutamine glutaminase family protein [Thermoanaerobaculia bacterium]|nr:protein-glutamine glutaminase family protein [Thermoanaerobaculia bacterium]
MANPNALFGTITELTTDLERGTFISLSDGRDARFEPNDRRVSVLEDLRRRKRLVYLDADDSGVIRNVLLPKVVQVDKIIERGGEISVTFVNSQARAVVKPGSDELRKLREAGKEGWLAVTIDDRFEVIDVRPVEAQFELPTFEPPPRLRWWHWCWWPWRWWSCWRRCVSAERAQELFDLCAATTCDPLTVPPPCIPFLYPDDGCWARAHAMCRIMIDAGATPRKIWIDGALVTPTVNNPNCVVYWGWHVAPTLCVSRSRWWFGHQEQVLDPSLFTTPVSPETWKSVQGDPDATLSASSYILFARAPGDYLDPTYAKTNAALADYRAALQLRSLGPDGPPPYANCQEAT